MLLRAAAVVAMLLAASSAVARMHAGPSQLHAGHRLQGAIAPLDGGGSFGSPAAAYSLRRLKSTYAGPGVKLRRASDSLTQDIGFLGFTGFTGAPLDVAAANAFCNATSCFVDTWYDQSGLGRHAVQATAALQPAWNASCVNGLPCMTTTIDGQLLATVSVTPALPVSMSAVMERDVAGPFCFSLGTNSGTGNILYINIAVNQWVQTDGVSFLTGVGSDGLWHAASGTVNGASSVLRLDATETTASLAGSVVAGPVHVSRNQSGGICRYAEAIMWNGYALTAAERTALIANQRSFWGF